MKNSILLSLLVVSTSSLASTSFDTRVSAAYRRADNNFDLDCYYRNNKSYGLVKPVSSTVRGSNFLKRDFIVTNGSQQTEMTFHVVNMNNKSKFQYNLYMDHKMVSSAVSKDKDFYIGPVNDTDLTKTFQTSQLFCNLNFAEDAPYVISDGDIHINVHPHLRYDPKSILRPVAEKAFQDTSMPHLLLLETTNERDEKVNIGDFFNGRAISLKPVDYPLSVKAVPEHVDLVVSPAGHNRYIFNAQNALNVEFTGGNHNFCMFNNARHILESLLKSESSAKVRFHYDAQKIIAQQLGVSGKGIDFPKSMTKASYHLKDLLSNDAIAIRYHQNYFKYFSGEFLQGFLGQFKTVKLTYSSRLFSHEAVIEGNGTRDLEVELVYSND